MIYLYSGTPGSGKSLHSLKDITSKLLSGGNVIANFPVNTSYLKLRSNKKKLGEFYYVPNEKLTTHYLTTFALTHHVKGKEKQTLLVIDEAQSLFNPREYARKDRKGYNHFFSLHRHLGYNVILITQNDRLLDRQIRCLIEYEIKHRKVNNFKSLGSLFPVPTFAAITKWYGVNEKISTEFFIGSKKLYRLYDSYALFDVVAARETGSGGNGGPGSVSHAATKQNKNIILQFV